MRDKLKSEESLGIYTKRQGLIDPVHGDDQQNKGWIQHHFARILKSNC